MNRFIASFVILIAAAIAASTATAKMHSIENKFLVVTYDDEAKTFSVKDKATGQVFLKDGKFNNVRDEVDLDVSNKVIIITCAKEIVCLGLEEDSPFVFVCGVFTAQSKEPIEIKKKRLRPCSRLTWASRPMNFARWAPPG